MKHVVYLAGAALALGLTVPAHAVVLEQKWQAGQNLGYDLALDGSVNLQSPADSPVPWAGIPLEISVKGDGKAQLQTLAVDDAGVGTVAFKLPMLQVGFETFGQQGQWNLRDGKSALMLNGKPLNIGNGLNLTALSNPTSAVRIGKDGRVRGVTPLKPTVQAPAPDNAAPVAPEKAIDQSALITAMVLQSLPSVWPGRDVQAGETWQVKLDIPPTLRPGGADAPTSLGTFDMTLKGEEQVGTKKLWRVGVVGSVQVDGAQWRKPRATPAAFQQTPRGGGRPAANMGNAFQLDSALQRVQGDVWLDAEAGQINNAELALNSQAQGRTAKPTGGFGAPSTIDFTGTLQLQLKPIAK